MIDFENWEEEYETTVKQIAAAVPVDQIAWISIGSLRMMPDLKKKMQDRFPKSKLPYGQWINGMDGKLRYFKHRRLELYKGLVEMLGKHLPGVTVYLTMESPEVYKKFIIINNDEHGILYFVSCTTLFFLFIRREFAV